MDKKALIKAITLASSFDELNNLLQNNPSAVAELNQTDLIVVLLYQIVSVKTWTKVLRDNPPNKMPKDQITNLIKEYGIQCFRYGYTDGALRRDDNSETRCIVPKSIIENI